VLPDAGAAGEARGGNVSALNYGFWRRQSRGVSDVYRLKTRPKSVGEV